MFAGRNGRLVVLGTKPRGCGEHHQRGIAGQGLLIGLQADEDSIPRNIDLFPVDLLKARDRAGGSVLECVGHHDELNVLVGVHHLCNRAGAASAGSDQGDSNNIAAGGVDTARAQHVARQRCSGNRKRRCLQKIATRRCLRMTH